MSQVAEILKGNELIARFDAVAPDWMVYDAEYGFAIQQLKANSYTMGIAEKNPSSLLAAMSNVAACGLSLNPAKKEAYLVPRKGKVCLDPSYMGICKLATDTGSILWAQAKLVYANDNFTTRGVDEKPSHEVNPFGVDRGEIVGVYCTVKTHDGSYLTETMSLEDVYKIRDRSEAFKANPQKTPWFTDPGEMIKKTVVKRASKMWPRSNNHESERRLAMAVQTSHDNEDVYLATSSPDLGQYTDEQKKFFDQLITDSDNLGMHVLQQTIGSGEMTNLYNSFEKGTITKYKRIVDDMLAKGFSEFTDWVNMAAEAFSSGDEMAIEQIKEEVSADAWSLIEDKAR